VTPIRIGVGGWTYPPWRGEFYPKGLPQKQELDYASRHLTSIEINSTYYRSQKPETFATWRDATPEGFVFALKAPRTTTNRRVLAEAGDSITRFFDSGVLELRDKLGPINWQFMPTKPFDPPDFEAFLKLLPTNIDGHTVRHAVEVRHASFACPDFVAMIRAYQVAIVIAGDSQFPHIAELTAPFVYARIMGTQESEASGYADKDLDRWADQIRRWASGSTPREVFFYVISRFKARNPASAMALIQRLQ
jgi:uncharacterized protein YecE (DUF72 family)